MNEILSILIVEGNPEDALFLTTILNKLREKGIEPKLKIAGTLEEAQAALKKSLFDILIVNLYLADSLGMDTFLEIQKYADSSPIILVGGKMEDEIVRDAIKLGAQDYLPKTDVSVCLLARIIHHAVERHRLHESLKALSFTDELTAVYNRRGFITLLEQQMAVTKRSKKGFYLFIVDLDYLKKINDTHGHIIGDHALIEAAKCIRTALRKHDIVGRLGGDEFAVVALNASQETGAYLKSHLIETVTAFNQSGREPYTLSFSIGKTYFDGTEELTLDELLQLADKDLYKEKRLSHGIR